MTNKLLFIIVLIQTYILNFIHSADSPQPLLRFSLKDKIIKDFEHFFLPTLLKNMTNLKINDTSISQHIDFIGWIYLDLTNIVFNIGDIKPEQINVIFNDNSTFSTIVDSLKANLTFDYNFRTNFLNSAGSGVGKLNELSLTMINKLFRLQNKRNNTLYGPGLAVDQFVFDHFNLEMTFTKDTPLEKFIVYLVQNLNQMLQRPVFESISAYILPTLNGGLKTMLENIPLSFKIPTTDAYAYYSLTEDPRFFNNTIELSFNARNSSNVIPHSGPDSSNLEAYLNQDLFQDLLNSIQTLGLIKFTVTSESIPDSSPIKFDTTSFALLIPDITKVFGKDKKMDMNCYSNSAPELKFNLNETKAALSLNCDFLVRNDSTHNVTAFVADLGVVTIFEMYLRQNFIKGEIKTLKMQTLEIKNSAVGPIDVASLKSNLNFILDPVVKLLINTYISSGFEVPTFYGISLADSYAESHEGYIETDLNPIFPSNFTNSNSDNLAISNDNKAEKTSIVSQLNKVIKKFLDYDNSDI